MPVRTLYNSLRGEHLPLVVDMYKKIIVPSIDERSQENYSKLLEPLTFDYFATNTKEKSAFYDWSDVKNNPYFSKGYVGLFRDQVVHNDIKGLWIGYESLSLISDLYPNMASPTYAQISMTNNGRPKIVKARIGRTFAKKVGVVLPFLNVEQVFLNNGKPKRSIGNRAALYIVRTGDGDGQE